MKPATQLVGEISDLIGAIPQFTSRSIGFSSQELEKILNQLEGYQRTSDIQLKMERPRRQATPPEFKTSYREKMSKYIKRNTGIKIPASSLVCARFYDTIADYLGL